MPLETRYVATVDGTTGDTTLEKMDATLGSSRLTASGSSSSTPGVKGRAISLKVTADDARFEDLLHLAIRGTNAPPMRGVTRTATLNVGYRHVPGGHDVLATSGWTAVYAVVETSRL